MVESVPVPAHFSPHAALACRLMSSISCWFRSCKHTRTSGWHKGGGRIRTSERMSQKGEDGVGAARW